MSDAKPKEDWSKPAAMAIGKGGYIGEPQRGRYGPIFPKTPACYGFSIMAKIIPGREPVFREYAKKIEAAVAKDPHCLAILKLHYLRWVLFDIGGATGIDTVFENLEGFPKDWKTNAPAFVEFVRKHQQPSFLEYGEYPFVSADEIKKALALKASFSAMLDQMQ